MTTIRVKDRHGPPPPKVAAEFFRALSEAAEGKAPAPVVVVEKQNQETDFKSKQAVET